MHFANRINQLLAASIGVVNAILAIFLVLIGLLTGIYWLGTVFGIIVGLAVGVALAVSICGTLAVLVNIRDLLKESQQNRS